MRVSAAARSIVGQKRQYNEDAVLLLPEQRFFAVVDGMGGGGSGDLAARAAVEAMRGVVQGKGAVSPFLAPPLEQALSAANRAILDEPMNRHHHMGCTVAAVQLAGTLLAVAHVGDCRVYRLDARGLAQLTTDHSLIEELRRQGHELTEEQRAQYANVVTRGLGFAPEVEVAQGSHFAAPGELLLLCSDGLHRELPDAELERLLREPGDLERCAERLVQAADAAGGRDNITALLVRVEG